MHKKVQDFSWTFFCDRGGVRTPNPQSRNLIFYPVELQGHYLCKKILKCIQLPACRQAGTTRPLFH